MSSLGCFTTGVLEIQLIILIKLEASHNSGPSDHAAVLSRTYGKLCYTYGRVKCVELDRPQIRSCSDPGPWEWTPVSSRTTEVAVDWKSWRFQDSPAASVSGA